MFLIKPCMIKPFFWNFKFLSKPHRFLRYVRIRFFMKRSDWYWIEGDWNNVWFYVVVERGVLCIWVLKFWRGQITRVWAIDEFLCLIGIFFKFLEKQRLLSVKGVYCCGATTWGREGGCWFWKWVRGRPGKSGCWASRPSKWIWRRTWRTKRISRSIRPATKWIPRWAIFTEWVRISSCRVWSKWTRTTLISRKRVWRIWTPSLSRKRIIARPLVWIWREGVSTLPSLVWSIVSWERIVASTVVASTCKWVVWGRPLASKRTLTWSIERIRAALPKSVTSWVLSAEWICASSKRGVIVSIDRSAARNYCLGWPIGLFFHVKESEFFEGVALNFLHYRASV